MRNGDGAVSTEALDFSRVTSSVLWYEGNETYSGTSLRSFHVLTVETALLKEEVLKMF